MEQTSNEQLLATGKISRLIIKFSIPCIIALVVGALYNIVDQIFIGNGVGYLGNAATNVVYPFTVIALGLALLIGDGAASLFSLSSGRKDTATANKTFSTALIVSVAVSAVLTALGAFFLDEVLTIFGVTENTYSYAKEYLTVILIGFPFYIIANSLNPLIRADGSPRYAMIATLSGAILNIILDPIAIFALQQGMKGAALATIIGQIVSFFIEAVYFLKPKTLQVTKASFRFDLSIFLKELKLGFTSFIAQFSVVIMIAVVNNIIGKYGEQSVYGADIPLSVTGIVMKVFGIVNSIALGLAAGSQPIVGYNCGAKQYDRVKKTYRCLILASVAVGLVATVLFEFFPQFIINIFGSEGDLYNEYAKLCFRIYLGSVMLTCFVRTSAVFLQSLGEAAKSMAVSLARDLIFSLPAMFVFSYLGGVVGMLWAPVLSDVLSAIVVIVLVWIEFQKFRRAENPPATNPPVETPSAPLAGQ